MQQFKDKDWLRVIAGHERPINSVFQIKSCLTRYKLSDVELWQPKEGEWCWFYDDTEGTPIFGRFYKQDKDFGNCCYPQHQINSPYSYCEPFIAELPSFLKEHDEK